ncbi:MAG TPA: hypothetical protein VKY40_10410 [Halanaerobiales bacterium]|nr:hypothetical protein [Halanaerobiales bacterium]
MSKPEELGFEVVHIGVNCTDELTAKKNAELFTSFFGFQKEDGKDSLYAGSFVELMKGDGRGQHGHIGIATNDINKAQRYLEKKGLVFDPDSMKYDNDGKPLVIYLKKEIAGFALHLLQK